MNVVFISFLASIAVPSFSEFLAVNEIFLLRQNLHSSLVEARNEALRVNATVSICPLANSEKCGDDWSEGWLSFQDDGKGGGVANDGVLNGNERKIAIRSGSASSKILVTHFADDSSMDHISFNSLGRPTVDGTELKDALFVSVCAKQHGAELARGLLMSAEGFITRTRDYDSDGAQETRMATYEGNVLNDIEYGLRCS